MQHSKMQRIRTKFEIGPHSSAFAKGVEKSVGRLPRMTAKRAEADMDLIRALHDQTPRHSESLRATEYPEDAPLARIRQRDQIPTSMIALASIGTVSAFSPAIFTRLSLTM
jgi:hypothetical protein